MWYLTCTDPNFNGTGQCSTQSWVLVEGLLPSLSIAQGLAIGSAIAGVWGLAFAAKMLRRFLWR